MEISGKFLLCQLAISILYIVILQINWIFRSLHWFISDLPICFLLTSSDMLSSDSFLLPFLLEFAEQVIYTDILLGSCNETEQTASTSFALHSNFAVIVIPLLLLETSFIKFLFRPHLEDEHFSWLEALPFPLGFICLKNWK